MTFNEAIRLFLQYITGRNYKRETISGYQKDLHQMNRYFIQVYNTEIYLEDLKTEVLEGYLHMLKDVKGYEPASQNRHLFTMRTFFKYCVKKEFLAWNPAIAVEQVQVPKKVRENPDESEIEQLLGAIDHKLIQMVARTLYMTGLRISECLNLTLDDVDLEKQMIHVRHGKGDKERYVPISDKLKPLLEDYLNSTRPTTSTPYFFATKKSGSLSDAYVNRVLANTIKKLGWKKKITAHVFRHAFACKLNDRNVNLVKIQMILGHADLKTTSIYLNANQAQLNEAVNVL